MTQQLIKESYYDKSKNVYIYTYIENYEIKNLYLYKNKNGTILQFDKPIDDVINKTEFVGIPNLTNYGKTQILKHKKHLRDTIYYINFQDNFGHLETLFFYFKFDKCIIDYNINVIEQNILDDKINFKIKFDDFDVLSKMEPNDIINSTATMIKNSNIYRFYCSKLKHNIYYTVKENTMYFSLTFYDLQF